MSAEARLKQLGIALPDVPAPVANYLPYRVAGNLLFLAGQGPRDANGKMLTGKVGAEVSVEEGYQRARLIGLAAAVRHAQGARLARPRRHRGQDALHGQRGAGLQGPSQGDQRLSDLFVEVFGEAGKHARSAVGMGSLPNQISVEIEGVHRRSRPERPAGRADISTVASAGPASPADGVLRRMIRCASPAVGLLNFLVALPAAPRRRFAAL